MVSHVTMKVHSEKSTWLIFLLLCFVKDIYAKEPEIETTTTKIEAEQKNNATKDILIASETGDPKKGLEIVKQIRRLNDDGSYTVGYEAEDGTFKIESRDVLGNVKGTFGYIDGDGEIKRVTYSSNNSTPPSFSTSSTMPTPTVRFNRTSPTTRRPTPTLVYPRVSSSTRATVIQAIPRKRPTLDPHTKGPNSADSSYIIPYTMRNNLTDAKIEEGDAYNEEKLMKSAQSNNKHITVPTLKEILQSKQTTTEPGYKTLPTYKPVYENSEKEPESPTKVNTFRRQLPGTSNENTQMVMLQQSAGDDSTDVYGGMFSIGTARPLFTTTTARPKLVPFHSMLAARQKLQQQLQQIPIQDSYQETNIEATTDRFEDHENVVTSNPVPVIHIPYQRDRGDERLYQQPAYRQHQLIQFRTRDYLKDNPGAAVPIGNQRQLYRYNYQVQPNNDEQFIRESTPQPMATGKSEPPDATTPAPYAIRTPITRIIPIPVDDRGVPIPGYQHRFLVNPYSNPPPPLIPIARPQIQYPVDPVGPISTPVTTRDLKKLLQYLLLRQNRGQALMDIRDEVNPGPPYQPIPTYRSANTDTRQYNADYSTKGASFSQLPGYQNNYVASRPYQGPPQVPQYNLNYRPEYTEPLPYQNRQNYLQQQEVYNNQVINYDANQQYDSQRFVPRRRYFRPQNYNPRYEEETNTNQVQTEQTDYLPAEVREALLLKMLMLAINPDFHLMSPEISGEMTTAIPEYRKKVRNVQILGEEGSKDEMKRRGMNI